MFKTLEITLTNGKTGDELEILVIHVTEGPYHQTHHVTYLSRDYDTDVSDADETYAQIEYGDDTTGWWIDEIISCIRDVFDRAAVDGKVPAWASVTPEMFDEDKWTRIEI